MPLIPLQQCFSIYQEVSLLPPEDLWSMDLMSVMAVEISHQEQKAYQKKSRHNLTQHAKQ